MFPPGSIAVALPVRDDAEHLPISVACIQRQTLPPAEILLALNGSDEPTRTMARRLAASDARIRILELPFASLPSALNLCLRESSSEFVARMDADDTCPPDRLAIQHAHLSRDPALAGVGCAWELADADGRVINVVRPPTEPAELAWRLLLGNTLAHGSMLLRRREVLDAGGYDERCDRAQDFDLWLRLAGRLACVPEVLYRHTTRHPEDPGRSTRDQAEVVAPLLARQWASLPPGEARGLTDAVRASLVGDHASGGKIAAALLARSPSSSALIAWLWNQWRAPAAPRSAHDAGRRALLREAGARLRTAGVREVFLWGAGDHTRWLLEHRGELGIKIAGVVDDRAAGAIAEFEIARPDSLAPGDVTLISSDWHEAAIWESSTPHRARGVHVERLYARA